MQQAGPLESTAEGVLLRVKVVPGASRSRLAGMLGDRLKVQVAAPPEAGKANAAVMELLAEAFGLSPREVVIMQGQTRPQKTVLLRGLSLDAATQRLVHLLEPRP